MTLDCPTTSQPPSGRCRLLTEPPAPSVPGCDAHINRIIVSSRTASSGRVHRQGCCLLIYFLWFSRFEGWAAPPSGRNIFKHLTCGEVMRSWWSETVKTVFDEGSERGSEKGSQRGSEITTNDDLSGEQLDCLNKQYVWLLCLQCFITPLLGRSLMIGLYAFYGLCNTSIFCFQATGQSFSPRGVIFGFRRPYTIRK